MVISYSQDIKPHHIFNIFSSRISFHHNKINYTPQLASINNYDMRTVFTAVSSKLYSAIGILAMQMYV